jgi:RHH-type transcriptional regulator, proline utilization regulon repressor / proline dehydrogenase / delta 1-pyrroline-5-carboxylate dehydrogenase
MSRAPEAEIKRIGQDIFTRMKGQKPSVFQKDWWSGKMMELSMQDESFKVEMFRFVDVYPTLRDPVTIAEHLQEYFCRPEQNFPAAFQWGLGRVKPDGMLARVAAGQIEKQIEGMAQKFIAGRTAAEALPKLREMWDQNLAFTLDLLGEATVSEVEASDYVARYTEILETLIAKTKDFPAKPTLEQSTMGAVPRVNVSIKISSLYSQIDPVDPQGSIEAVKARLRPLFLKAKQHGAFINLDMEQYALKDLTFALFKSLMSEPELKDYPHAGIVIQAYLRDAASDAEMMCAWAKERGTPVTVRLVKGAYWDYETIHAAQQGWPIPVFGKKWETDASYERCAEILLNNVAHIRAAIGSHNVRSIAHAIAHAQANNIDKSAVEFQMLYGMAEPMKLAVQQLGYRVRDYVPIGELVPGMAYLVRRLLENTSNESWLRASFADGKSIDELLAAPTGQPSEAMPAREPITSMGFRSEPMFDFSRGEHRAKMAQAIEAVRGKLGQTYQPIIDGKPVTTTKTLDSFDPSRTEQRVGTIQLADVALMERAIEGARRVQPAWAAQTAQQRGQVLVQLAKLMQARRAELAAWMCFEVGKSWVEADADVCEAIDFCQYYAREAVRLGYPQRLGRIPGELNIMHYKPRGVCGVIAPWNFPLAILCGMTVAAAVTGNTVLVKPAEQSSVIAALFAQLCQEAGFPAGVVQFVPGLGEDVGRALVAHPQIQTIAFTGSMDVGLEILRVAGDTKQTQREVKRVICEMGGKNAIIVDADADLDEAVSGVLHSAFGYQGQKCSACSRVIVVRGCYDEFCSRLVEAARSLEIGPSWDPAYAVGPVIDADSVDKIKRYIAIGQQEGKLLLGGETLEGGHFVKPTIFTDIKPDARLAQEEIFGPVLAIIAAEGFEQALQIANDTRYALTGAVYSRSPNNIARAREAFDVGNLYINRGSTGALVGRQPFGGHKMSGAGTKAGGPDYLLQFVVPRNVTENTMRRGFAPAD